MTDYAPPTEGVNTSALSADEAIHYLRRLIALDGAFYPCVDDCRHLSCEVEYRVLAILERVR